MSDQAPAGSSIVRNEVRLEVGPAGLAPADRARAPRHARGPGAWAIAWLVLLAAAPALGAGKIGPGAYCPLPERGEAPKCLEPARAHYPEFFRALDRDELDSEETARLEADVAAGASADQAFLALSSLAYGYYRMAQRAAREPRAHAEVVMRLERWNELLAAAYEASPGDPDFQEAVRQAAADVHRRAPAVGLACLDEGGGPARCDSTEAVVRALHRARDRTGVRGVLRGLLGRLLGGNGG